MAALASSVADRAETIDTPRGHYLKWAPPTGEQLWLQVTRTGDAMGMNPHFEGQSRLRAALEARVTRKAHTPLDGTFLAWANPPADGSPGGDYPFAFDCPDAATTETLTLPTTVTLQLAAFAQELTVHASEQTYRHHQAEQGTAFPSRSFIPSGLMTPAGEPVVPPESHALMVGDVVEASERHNEVSGETYWWALLHTVGGTVDLVVDPALLPHPIRRGNIVSGWFWLSGRIRRPDPPRAGWLGRLTGHR